MRRPALLLSVLVLTLGSPGLASAAGPVAGDTALTSSAARATTWHSKTQPYVRNWVFRSTKINRCVFIEVSGAVKGRWRYAYGPSSPDRDTLDWDNLRLVNPRISATPWPIRGAGCDSTKRWAMKANLSQGWYQQRCSLKVSLSAGVPWSVSATPTYTCGDNRLGHRRSTEGRASSTLNQYNSGAPVHFSGTLASVRGGGIGLQGVIGVRAHTKSSSDYVKRTLNVSINK